MFDSFTLILISVTFLLAGGVKGVIGLGLPTVSLALLAVTLDFTTAIALFLIPSFVTNIWQTMVGGHARLILHRIWPFLFFASIAIWPGSIALSSISPVLLTILLGALLICYALLNLIGFKLSISVQRNKWAGPTFGIMNGLLTGMTGTFVVPGVIYLQAIGLSRDMLVQAMGMLFALSTIVLALALRQHELLTSELISISAFAVIPAIIGMLIGQSIRCYLSENRFRKVFFISLLILGALIIIRTLLYK